MLLIAFSMLFNAFSMLFHVLPERRAKAGTRFGSPPRGGARLSFTKGPAPVCAPSVPTDAGGTLRAGQFSGAFQGAWPLTPGPVASRTRAHDLRNVPAPFWNLGFAAFGQQNARTAS